MGDFTEGVHKATPGAVALAFVVLMSVAPLAGASSVRPIAAGASPPNLRIGFQERVDSLNPFMGIMAVSPPRSFGMVSSTPPGAWGGNMDLKYLGRGATLYLPVFNPGAQFFTGDGHALQGDGEVDGGAIEISLAPTLQFFVRKGKSIKLPRAETATDYLTTGLSVDLNEATKMALEEAVGFLQTEKGLSAADAYALASLAVDLGIGEAVDVVNLVYAKIPKNIFRDNPPYWFTPSRAEKY